MWTSNGVGGERFARRLGVRCPFGSPVSPSARPVIVHPAKGRMPRESPQRCPPALGRGYVPAPRREPVSNWKAPDVLLPEGRPRDRQQRRRAKPAGNRSPTRESRRVGIPWQRPGWPNRGQPHPLRHDMQGLHITPFAYHRRTFEAAFGRPTVLTASTTSSPTTGKTLRT